MSGASRSAPEDSAPTKPDQDAGAPETSETGASRAAIARGVGKVTGGGGFLPFLFVLALDFVSLYYLPQTNSE